MEEVPVEAGAVGGPGVAQGAEDGGGRAWDAPLLPVLPGSPELPVEQEEQGGKEEA